MRPPTPNLSSILSSAAYIRDPSTSPTRLESPIDTLAQYLSIPDDSSLPQDPELTPTMQFASLTNTYSPLLQHQREQQLQALQQQQCIPGLAQIYTPLASMSGSVFNTVATSSSLLTPLSPSPSAALDDADIDFDADDDYVPGSSSRKRSSSPASSQKNTASSGRLNNNTSDASSPPAPKRQRAAPSGPISTKDWVPPDVTGLNKREARLVKNRAAAFLSRQRKREEFELMEIRVQELESENARLRQTAPSSSSPSDIAAQQQSQPTASEHQQFQALLAQLAESQKREEALAAQLRDAQSTLARQQQQSSPSPSYHQPVISHWPTMGRPTPVVVKEEAMDEDERASPVVSKSVATDSDDSDSSSSNDSDDSDVTNSRKISVGRALRLGRKEKDQLLVREKGHGSGSVALMVLLFSLSLLSGQKGSAPATAAGEGSNGHAGAGASGKNPSQFSFSLPGAANAPAYDFRLPQQPQQSQQAQAPGTKREDGTDGEHGENAHEATKRWATTLDSLDDEFNYFDRQQHVVPSDFSGMGMGGMDFGSFGGLGGLGLGFDDAAAMGLGMNMGMNMGGMGMGDGMDGLAYPALNTFGSPFSLASPASLPAPSQTQRAMSPSAVSTTSGSVSTITSASGFNRQLEVSVSSIAAEASDDGVSFDLRMAPTPSSSEDAVDGVASEHGDAAEKKITVRVRKVTIPSSSTSSLSLSSSSSDNKKTILLELTSSSSSADSAEGSDDASAELDALNADFEALLGRGLGSLAMPSSLGSDAADGAQWRLALAPRDAI